jgi:hypothetical protein
MRGRVVFDGQDLMRSSPSQVRSVRGNRIAIANAKPDHDARCWGTQDVPGGGWLKDVDWRRETGDAAVIEDIRREAAQVVAAADESIPLPPDAPTQASI